MIVIHHHDLVFVSLELLLELGPLLSYLLLNLALNHLGRQLLT